MLVKQSDTKNTLPLIGEYLAYYNLFRKKSDLKYGSIKNIPESLKKRTEKHRINRNNIAHEVWEIIHGDIYSANEGKPNWVIKSEELKEFVEELILICIDLNY